MDLASLYEAYRPLLAKEVIKLNGQARLAGWDTDDAFQEASVAFLLLLGRYRPEAAPLPAYLKHTLWRTFRQRWRNARRKRRDEALPPWAGWDWTVEHARHLAADPIGTALAPSPLDEPAVAIVWDRLTSDERDIVWARIVEERPAAEVGACFGLTERAVYQVTQRVLRRLRRAVGVVD